MQEVISTHLTIEDKAVLQRLATNLPRTSSVALEIGSYLGASATIIAKNSPDNCRLFCVDTWQNDAMSEGKRDTFAEFLNNTKEWGQKISTVRKTSAEAAADFQDQIDLLFIDADHSYEGCKTDALAWLSKVRIGGVVAFHDVGWAEGVKKVIREIFLPLQDGQGQIEGNIYWGRIKSAGDAQENPTVTKASTYVISAKSAPSSNTIKQLKRGLGANPWTWIFAGLEKNSNSTFPKLDGAKVVAAGVPGLVAGRHKALQDCSEDIIIYLDDDVSLPEGWLEAMLEPFADPSVHLVGCRYLPEFEGEPPGWLEQFWTNDAQGRYMIYLSLLDYGTETKEIDPTMIWGLCYAIRRETLVKLGGFHPDGYPWELRRYRGDGETAPSILARQLGLKAIYQGKTMVYHKVPKSRMTPDYFKRRAYLQGVSDSYTRIRAEGKAAPFVGSWKNPLRQFKRFLLDAVRKKEMAFEEIHNRIARAYRAGYDFHQNEVRHDPKLLEWVVKPDYFDYRLPDGWERFIA